jgi:hypothetical protein
VPSLLITYCGVFASICRLATLQQLTINKVLKRIDLSFDQSGMLSPAWIGCSC